MGVIPSSYPVDLIHLFTSGPQEAILQIAMKPGAAAGEDLREKLRASLSKELPGTRISFEAGDIVSQVMSFGSPTPIEVAVMGSNLPDDVGLSRKRSRRNWRACLSCAICSSRRRWIILRSTSTSIASAPANSD